MPPIRTLYVMLNCDFPPRTGTPQRIWRNIQLLSKLGPIAVFSVGWNVYPDETLPGVECWRHVDTPWPQNTSRWQKVRERFVRIFHAAQYRTRYATSFHLAGERQTNDMLARFIADFQPTVAIIDHWMFAILPEPLWHRTFPLIVSSHDVEWQLLRDTINTNSPFHARLRAYLRVLYFRWLEARLYRAADRVWTVSERDRLAIQRFTGLTSQVRALPIVTEIDYYESVRQQTMAPSRSLRSPHDGPTVFYAGAYWWEPNIDAAHLLITEIYPALREMYPGTRLLLVGRSPTPRMEAAARADDHIVVTGVVDDIRPYLAQSDIAAVPLLVGGGMRSKIIEAFAAGLPVVSTTKGYEGIDVMDGRELLVRDGVRAFVQGIADLWEDPAFARSLVERAFAFVRIDYSMEAMERRLRSEVNELMATGRGKT